MALAIFDLDETLIATDSDYQWGQYVVDRRLVNPAAHKRKNDAFYASYRAGKLDIDEYLAFSCALLAHYTMEELEAYRSDFFRERIAPTILSAAVALVDQHRVQGDTLLVVTSTIEFVTRPIVDAFGIDTLIAPVPEVTDGRYTGKITGTPSFGEGKVTRLQAWLEETNHSLAGSTFYSDSHNDLPLLRLVDNPVAVDPDSTLRRQALANGWRIISLRE